MSTTTTVNNTLQLELDKANPNTVPDVLREMKLGTMLAGVIEKTITLSTYGTAFTLTPPALIVRSFRVSDATGGNAATGARLVGDSGATPSATIAKLSADGTTITVEGTGALSAVVSYIPMPAVAMSNAFPDS